MSLTGSNNHFEDFAVGAVIRHARGKTVVTVLPDSATRYITKFLSDAWMRDYGFLGSGRDLGLVEDPVDRAVEAGRHQEVLAHPEGVEAERFRLPGKVAHAPGLLEIEVGPGVGGEVEGEAHARGISRERRAGRRRPRWPRAPSTG